MANTKKQQNQQQQQQTQEDLNALPEKSNPCNLETSVRHVTYTEIPGVSCPFFGFLLVPLECSRSPV